jgi:hypothetical protein
MHATGKLRLLRVRQTYAEMGPFLSARRYVNYLDDDDETGDPVAAA